MSAKELIEKLSELDPDTEVFYEIDGGACRMGNFMRVSELEAGDFLKRSYGGYDRRAENMQSTVGDPISGVVVS